MAMSPDCWCRCEIDLAGVGGEADGRIDVADLADGVADQVVERRRAQVGLGGDFAGHDGQVGGDQRFAGHAAVGSALRQWSRIASLIWSATLSGWPMETDSLVNK